MAIRVTDRRVGYDKLREAIFGPSARVLVGITEENGSQQHKPGSEATVLQIAIWNEFGNGLNSPERAPLRSWFDQNQATVEKWLIALMPSFLRGARTQAQILDILGLKIVGAIQKTMTGAGLPPPNAPSTIARKGSSTATVEDGILRSKITHVVKNRGEK